MDSLMQTGEVTLMDVNLSQATFFHFVEELSVGQVKNRQALPSHLQRQSMLQHV